MEGNLVGLQSVALKHGKSIIFIGPHTIDTSKQSGPNIEGMAPQKYF